MKICHAFISLRLSFVKVMRCVGFETDLVKSYNRRRKQRFWMTTLQQKLKAPTVIAILLILFCAYVRAEQGKCVISLFYPGEVWLP